MVFWLFSKNNSTEFDQITVHRINVVEPDGTLRRVISNHDKLPGIIVHGKEKPFDGPQAGVIFYNGEGSENGGLIFGGRKNQKGEVVNSGGRKRIIMEVTADGSPGPSFLNNKGEVVSRFPTK